MGTYMPFPIGSKCLHINKEKAQTFAIRRTVHHKPHRNMGNLRPLRGSSYILCQLVAMYGGDYAAIEQICLHSLRNALQIYEDLLKRQNYFVIIICVSITN